MKNPKYIFVGVVSLIVLIAWVYYWYFFWIPKTLVMSSKISHITSSLVATVGANPDYICIKQVENPPCADLNNPPWNGTSSRVRTGRKLTQVAYYSVRIGCAEWGVAQHIGDSGGASGRRTADFPYSYGDSCMVIETDTTPPESNPNAN